MLVNLVVSKLDQSGRREAGNRVDVACRWGFPLLFLVLNALNALYFFVLHQSATLRSG